MPITTTSSLVRRELLIFDASVFNLATLLSALPAKTNYFLLNATHDGLGQIVEMFAV